MASNMQYAGFIRRLLAFIIDLIIIEIPLLFVTLILYLFFRDSSAGNDVDTAIRLIFVSVYLVGFWTWRGQTPGKMLFGIRLVNKDGNPLGFGRSVLRMLGYAISAIVILIGFLISELLPWLSPWYYISVSVIILFVGFLWIIFDKEKQGLHDKIAGTYAIKTRV